jgi:hypothetical protein
MSLHHDRDFFPDLFRRLRAAPPGSQEWADLVAFLQVLEEGEGWRRVACTPYACAVQSPAPPPPTPAPPPPHLPPLPPTPHPPQELCGLTKHLQASQRNSLLLRLVGLGLFEVIGTIMRTGDPAVKLRATGA